MLSLLLSRAEATGCSNYLKMLLKNGERRYPEDPNSYWEFCYRLFHGDNVMILDSEEAEKLYKCIKTKSIYFLFCWWTFLSVFFPFKYCPSFYSASTTSSTGEVISLLGHQHTKQLCVFPFNFPKMKDLMSVSKDVTEFYLVTFK